MEPFDFSENPPIHLKVPSLSVNHHPSTKEDNKQLEKLNIVLLGDVGVGKTSIAQR